MRDFFYHVIGFLYKMTKTILRKNTSNEIDLIWNYDINEKQIIVTDGVASEVNGESINSNKTFKSNELYYGDNYLLNCRVKNRELVCMRAEKLIFDNAYDAWEYAMNNAIIPAGFCNSGLTKVGFIQDSSQLCLSSWIWTSGKILQYYVAHGEVEKAKILADEIIKRQESVGGWIVRNDILNNKIVPVLAQNDSAFMVNKGILSLYEAVNDERYLEVAKKCASWIMDTTRQDGLVPTGIAIRTNETIDDRIIVDTGFTAGLFAKLYALTMDEGYRTYAVNFCSQFIKYFFDPEKQWFVTNIDANYEKHGGSFFRGQAWALEGLIETYEISQNSLIFDVVEKVTQMLVKYQLKDGGWSSNLERWYMGEDGKGIPIVASLLLKWHKYSSNKESILRAVDKAIAWTQNHTAIEGAGCGLIFAYSFEGAISHSFYTKTAMYYSTAYAIELVNMRKMIYEN